MARTATKTATLSTERQKIEPTHQALKSAQTKARLVEATIRCLIKHGYSKTTTPKVAEEAGLSRGAMLHHFENGSQLMQATIVELHHKRLRAFRRAAETRDHNVRSLVRAYWSQVLRPNFIAFHELSIAARTDKELAAILEPVRVEFRERWHELAIQLFPEWQQRPDHFRVALALSQNLLEGMAVNRLTHGLDENATEALLDHLERQILALREAD
jgi:AcrR family transcriptional regulator